jgi:hypothetical protein
MAVHLTSARQGPLISRSRARIVVVFVFAVIPLSFLGNQILGFQLSGWAWLLILAAAAPVVLTEPLHARAVHLLLPYLGFVVYAAVSLSWTDTLVRASRPLRSSPSRCSPTSRPGGSPTAL